MKIVKDDLFDFQIKKSAEIINILQKCATKEWEPVYNRKTGKLEPFICRLKAITGAGKTPILANTTNYLKDSIILWTTSLGSVVTQTYHNLSAGGKYNDLLPVGTKVYMLNDMSLADWNLTMSEKSGVTILLSTVASFNQDGDTLKVHQKGRYGDASRWEMLSRYGFEREARNRNLYVFYDEGHNATAEQFRRLADLNPIAFVLASASPFPSDLMYLLPGDTIEEKEQHLRKRTAQVKTKDVVNAGLLKTRLYFSECQIAYENALFEANKKFCELKKIMEKYNKHPIMCAIVNETIRGVDIWEKLVDLGVDKGKIAVHLNNAKEVAIERYGGLNGLVDTYTGKKSNERSPEKIIERGFEYIIWNMTLREGWDEPLAYVAYVDDCGKSETDMVQKIGRFLRQPDGKLFAEEALNASYFYFNVKDQQFIDLIKRTQDELEIEGHEVIRLENSNLLPTNRDVPVREKTTIPLIYCMPGKTYKNDEIIKKYIKLLAESECKKSGEIRTQVYDVAIGENKEEEKVENREESGDVSVWEYLSDKLYVIDSRIVGPTSSIFSSELKNTKQMRQRIQWGSSGMEQIDAVIGNIVHELEEEIELVVGDENIEAFEVQPFTLVNPDLRCGNKRQEERYKVKKYTHSVHEEYNGMNEFEVQVAEAFDKSGKKWLRNPSSVKGYSIPIPMYGADSANFRPDFIIWGKNKIWAVDPKGKHLLDTAVTTKLMDFSEADINIAFILEGAYKQSGATFVKDGKLGYYTLVYKKLGGVKAKLFKNLDDLVGEL